jgi:transketolase
VSVGAGIALGWRELVGEHGMIISIETYGASAEYSRIHREYAITAHRT